VVLPESVVLDQWPKTLKLINAPQSLQFLNPGQCVRVGVYATGDNRDEILAKTRLSFTVQALAHTDSRPLSPLVAVKQIKPQGADFVAGALGAAGIKMPPSMQTMASLGVSADSWCVADDAVGGSATVQVEVEFSGGHKTITSPAIPIESFETGSKKSFKDIQEMDAFSRSYYRQPNPARLLPALEFILEYQRQHSNQATLEIVTAFLSAALRSSPAAAKDFKTRVASLSPLSRAVGLMILRSASYDVGDLVSTLSPEEQQKFLSLPQLQDPFDLTPTQALFQHLDMLWAVFEATGQFAPVKTVTDALAWKGDYEDFDSLRKRHDPPSTLTPSIIRGVTYTAAGWSLYSFQRNDGLVADYIAYLQAATDTPSTIKSELGGLAANPAFKKVGQQ
jgi:hypothetical protein